MDRTVMDTKRDMYLKALESLPVKVSVKSDVWKVFFPHLSGIKISELAKEKKTEYIATPGVLARGVIHVVSVERRKGELTIESGFGPTTAGRKEGDFIYRYSKEALAFSKENWGRHLIDYNDLCEVHRILLQDPHDLTVADQNIWVALKWPLSSGCFALDKDKSAPLNEAYDRAIIFLTENRIFGRELCASVEWRNKDFARCSRCGWGFDFPCPGCATDFKFKVHHAGHIGDCCLRGAMSRKVAEKFQLMGHAFLVDPQEMMDKERANWQESAKRSKDR